MRYLKYLIISMMLSSVCIAGDHDRDDKSHHIKPYAKAPEIDASASSNALVILAGVVILMKEKRRRNSIK